MEDQEGRKHLCRICQRSFPCGRSLGGHMRSHGGAAATSQPPPSPATQRPRNLAEAAYALRENPKKTRRASESAGEEAGKEETDLALSLMMLSRDSRLWFKKENGGVGKKREREEMEGSSKKRRYECKSCGRNFTTHQALGGHRASHKRSLRRGGEDDEAREEVTPASSATVEESSTAGSEILQLSDERETGVGLQWPPLLDL